MIKSQNKIEKLIAERCSSGVEFKCFSNLLHDKTVTTITPSKKLAKKYYNLEGKFPIVDQGQNFIVGYTNDEISVIENGEYVIFGDHTEAIKYIDFSFAQGADGIKILKTDRSTLHPKYLYYALNNFYLKIGKYTRHFSFLKKTIIPIPPIPIQQEIVKILDSFTELEAKLEAELEARIKQYEYYRRDLLNYKQEVKWVQLRDIADIKTGQSIGDFEILNTGQYPYINAGIEASGYLEESNSEPETITIPSRGQGGAGHVGYQKRKFWCGSLCYRIQSCSNEMTTKFIYYYLKDIQDAIIGLRQTGSIPAVNKKELEFVKIPMPNITKQREIVSILDKFDALVNDISIGLPAELKARHQQYEYYRNKLLTFKEYGK